MEVACAGILVADVFASPIARIPDEGELIATSGFITSAGGCAANVAVDLQILGRRAAVAGKVGTDMLGDFVIADLSRHGIGVDHIRRTSTQSTSATVIVSVVNEDRRYIHSIGANAEFTVEDVDLSILENARVLYAGGYLAMPSFGPDQAARLFAEAKQRGVITVLDVVMPAGLPPGLEQVRDVLPYTDYFLPNQDEALRLTGQADPHAQAEYIARLAPDCTVAITRGPLGVLTRCGGEFIETKPFAVETVDESGAGDAFTAGLIAALLEHWELERALMFAAAVGASCTRALGCSQGVFTFDEAVAFLECSPARAVASER